MTAPKRLIALDVETADDAHRQICSIALVQIEGDQITGEWSSLVRPAQPPTARSVEVHGLSWAKLHDAPTFKSVWPVVLGLLDGAEAIVAHYAKFDRGAVEGNCATDGLKAPTLPWICTVELARLAWPKPGLVADHKLPTLAKLLQLELTHHDALSDARACAAIYLAALARTGELRAQLNGLTPSSAAAPSPVVSTERRGTEGAHAWVWTEREGYKALKLNDHLLVEEMTGGSLDVRIDVYLSNKIVALHLSACHVATKRRDELLVEALRTAVLVTRASWGVSLSAATWKRIVDSRPGRPA